MKNLLVIDDDAVFNQIMVKQLAHMGYNVQGVRSWSAAQGVLGEMEPDLVILDHQLPDADSIDLLGRLVQQAPVIILTAYGSVQNAVRAIKAGAAEYLTKPINLEELELAVTRVLENATLRRECQFLKHQVESQSKGRKFLVGESPACAKVEQLIDMVAPSDMTVLIQGESGSGKELVANAIHQRSLRVSANFVAIDCCSLQEKLFESEVFGHERGAFTGADRQKKGLIEMAPGGTLFLDEIGEIEPAIQAKLLRVLETGTFRRLGGNKNLHADVRIVAATNRDLARMSQEGSFRADLYYRLSAFVVPIPPLRERREDIPLLVQHFVANNDFSRKINKVVGQAAMSELIAYDWPGNIRELKNVLERAIILSRDQHEIRPEHITIAARREAVMATQLSFAHEPTFEEIERHYLKHLLTKYSGHRATVAAVMGISERNTYRLIKKYGLS